MYIVNWEIQPDEWIYMTFLYKFCFVFIYDLSSFLEKYFKLKSLHVCYVFKNNFEFE